MGSVGLFVTCSDFSKGRDRAGDKFSSLVTDELTEYWNVVEEPSDELEELENLLIMLINRIQGKNGK